MPVDFAPALAKLLTHNTPIDPTPLHGLIRRLINNTSDTTSHDDLRALQDDIEVITGGNSSLDLVYGGATRIKGYVFEAPKLPEIRGASALLDWINETALPQLWDEQLPGIGREGIVFASGGHILGFAPLGSGEGLAQAIERRYTHETLNADAVAVSLSIPLLSLRYGREPLSYWYEDFIRDWRNDQLYPMLHAAYALPPKQVAITASDAELRDLFFGRKTFGELVMVARTMAYRRRAERHTADGPRNISLAPLLPWSARCDSSDIRPAVWRGIVADEIEPREISAASARKRVAGQVAKGSQKTSWFTEAFQDWVVPDDLEIDSWEAQWERYLRTNPGTPYALERASISGVVEPASDVHVIGHPANGYIGLIYADGNRVGQYIDSSPTPGAFKERSEQLREAARSAVFAGLSRHLAPYRGFHPFEIIAIGGDDLLIIVPGNRAFDVAQTIAHSFEQAMGEQRPRSHSDRYLGELEDESHDSRTYQPVVGLSAGIVIAQETAPIFFLRDLVQELLDQAKTRAAEHVSRGDTGGAVDFMVLKSITMVTNQIKGFRTAALQRNDRHLTARPYTWHEFAGFVSTIRSLKAARVPRSQLYRIAEVLAEQPSVAASTLEYLYTRARLNRVHGEALITHIERNWRPVPDQEAVFGPSAPPWLRLHDGGWETIWNDLVEAYEMVEEIEEP